MNWQQNQEKKYVIETDPKEIQLLALSGFSITVISNQEIK